MDAPLTPELKQLMDTMPGIWYSKNLQSTFQYANQRLAELDGFRHQDEMIGLTDHDLRCEAAESVQLFQAQDREVFRTGQTLRVLDIHRYSHNQWRTLLFTVAPLRDQQQNIVGTIGHGKELNPRYLLTLSELLGTYPASPQGDDPLSGRPVSYILGSPADGPELSQAQQEVLFLLLHGCATRLIGRTLGITKRMIEQQLHTLREKFSVPSDRELVDQAARLGYPRYLPPHLGSRLCLCLPAD